jgi:hypothetical protein
VLATLGSENADSGRARYQVQVNICKRCRHAEQVGNGEAHPIAPAVAEMVLCDAQVIDASDPTHVGQKAKTTIPRAIRRLVMLRDNGRCGVPGCTNSTFVQAHQLTARTDGGRHDSDNLGCLCCAHHRAVHEGRLIIEGRPSTGLVFKHADGTPYGGALDSGACGPKRAGVCGPPDDGLQGTRLPDGCGALLEELGGDGYSRGDAACCAGNAGVVGSAR